MFIIKYKKIFLLSGLVLVLLASLFIGVKGLTPSIEFTGGSLTQVAYPEGRPELPIIETRTEDAGFESFVIQPVNENEVMVRTKDLVEEERVALLEALNIDGTMEEVSFTSVGPSIGKELQTKATVAIIVVSIVMILFIAYTFREVAKPVSSWKYGFVAIVTLVHDVALATGMFVLLGGEMDALFVVALLTILGLSINDTIVIFDRIRENIRINMANNNQTPFGQVVGKSLEQSYTRSINTSVATIIVLLALVFFGPESTKMFALTLTFGMFFGTYSSIFLASPLLVQIYEWQKNK
jgi:preprotein translocase subunit SecF